MDQQLRNLPGEQVEASFDHSDGVVLAWPKHDQVMARTKRISIATCVLITIANAGAITSRNQANTQTLLVKDLETATNP
jgi:hypothetical protein